MGIAKQLAALGCLLVGLVVITFSVVASLQQEKTYSELLRSRLAVTVEGAARPFKTITELGLPPSMLRNRGDVLRRAHDIDSKVEDVVLFNPSGIVVERSGTGKVQTVPKEVLIALGRSDTPGWTLETSDFLIAGRNIYSQSGDLAGAVYASYPLTELVQLNAQFRSRLFLAALTVFIGGCLLSLLVFGVTTRRKLHALSALEADIEQANAALDLLESDVCSDGFPSGPLKADKLPLRRNAIPETEILRQINGLTMAVYSALVLGVLLALAITVQIAVSESLEPELEKRAELVSHILVENVETALANGVPAAGISGLGTLMTRLRKEYPEIDGLELKLDERVTRSGTGETATFTHRSILPDATEIQISVSSDPTVIASQFRKLFFDLAVVAVFALLLAVEIAVLQTSRSLVVPVTGLSMMTRSVMKRDLSFVFPLRWPAVKFDIAQSMSGRVARLHGVLARSGKKIQPLSRLQLTSLADIRLGLFLFAVADEAPLSFFALFVQELRNPLAFLPDEMATTLPFAGYLFAALLCAPFARPIGKRIGYRSLFVIAALLTFVAKVGLYASEDVLSATLWQSLNGAFFVLAMLSCQDYALDTLPGTERIRSVATFRSVLFSGVFAGTAIGGILADRAGDRLVFLFCAALALFAALLIFKLLPGSQPKNESSTGGHDSGQGLSLKFFLAFKDWRFCALAFGVIVPQAIIDHVFISYLLALLMDAAGASITMIAQVMMLFFLSLIVAGYAAANFKTVSRHPARVLAVSTFVSGLSLVVAGQDASFQSLLVVSVITGASLGLSGGPITDIALQIAETRLTMLGTTNVLGMVRVLERGGAAGAMIAAGTFAAFFGFERTASAIGIYATIAAVVFLVFAVSDKEGPE